MTIVDPRYCSVSGTRRGSSTTKPSGRRFGCDLLGRHAVQMHHDVFGMSAPCRVGDLAATAQRCAPTLLDDRQQLARVPDLGDVADLRRRRNAVLVVEAVHRVRERRGDDPARMQMRAGTAQERLAARRVRRGAAASASARG